MPDNYIKRSDAIAFICKRCIDAEWCDGTKEDCPMKNQIAKIHAADVEPKRKWISVEDSLPEKHVHVLVYSISRGIGIDYINNAGQWYTTPKVLFWMPLPQKPKLDDDWVADGIGQAFSPD